MLSIFQKEKKTHELDDEIGRVLHVMETTEIDSPEYTTLLTHAETLIKIRDKETPDSKVTLKDWLPVIGSLGGIAMIIVFEAAGHTITSKAASFIPKMKA